ncbi:hypothetical protein L1S32_02140 [Methanogenium sp. S4BF]|uniref:hypothetical protein n=1 Tax=Methanogenium sp. S4BF TaxID=1789226 RepID=UPI002415D804|nr:hypothetical protein [Methanogenium sp. S4BF]WFN34941.1 hypothetical protein L1S32_02140 [Methanogenium sp. S4BF]
MVKEIYHYLRGVYVDYAIRKGHFGSEELIYAKDPEDSRYIQNLQNSQLICPECREPVIFINTLKRIYFRHTPNNPNTHDCPNYSDSKYAEQYQQQQELRKSGQRSKRIYISKSGETFGLFLGFPPLDEEVVVAAKNEHLVIQIINPNHAELKENKLLINQVIPRETTFIRLMWIYDNYSLKYSECSVSDDIINIWDEDLAGLPESGALFAYRKDYARGISDYGEITTDKYYYFATATEIPDSYNDFLEYEFAGKLEGRTIGYESKWMIYRVQFTKVTENAHEFANLMRVELIEWHPPLIPIWPPHVQFGNRQVYSRPTTVVSLAQRSDESDYYQETDTQSCLPIPKYRINAGWLLSSSVKGSMHITSSSGQYESHLTCEYTEEISQYFAPEITLEYEKKTLENGDLFLLKEKPYLSFKSDSKCNIYHYSERQLKNIHWNKMSILEFFDLSKGDRICVRHGMDIVYQVAIPKHISKVINASVNNDEEIHKKLVLLGGTFIPTPVNTKYILSNLGNYPKVSGYLRQALQYGKIPQHAYDNLISEFT